LEKASPPTIVGGCFVFNDNFRLKTSTNGMRQPSVKKSVAKNGCKNSTALNRIAFSYSALRR
jgi:hypothetical protein